jgi:hypothetical protein
MQTAPAKKYLHTRPVFLLSIDWGARQYRFATKSISVQDGNTSRFYTGTLENPDFNLQLDRYDFQVEADSIPFALVFDVNVANEQSKGNYIDASEGELSYVLQSVENGEILTTYDDRVILYRGIVSQPIYGHIEQPTGYVEFSLEAKAIVNPASLLDMINGVFCRVTDADMSNVQNKSISPMSLCFDPDGFIEVQDVHYGKVSPFVFGQSDVAFKSRTMTPVKIPMSPAYVIAYKNDPSVNLPIFLLIAGHQVDAITVTIADNKGNTDTGTVQHFVNFDNHIFSFCKIETASTTLQSAIVDNTVEYYCVWDSGGAYPSPYRPGPLEGGGDLCMWILSQSTDQIDYDRWNSVAPLLNRYKFAGFVNDPTFEPYKFLQDEILPLLPVGVTVGPNGLMPVIDLMVLGDDITAFESITVSNDFQRNSPIETSTDLSSLVNEVELNFARSLKSDKYLSRVNVTPQKTSIYGARNFMYSDDYAMTSYNIYGRRSVSIDTDFVFDYKSAVLIARHMIRAKCTPKRTIDYLAAPRFGYLHIGDIIALTDDNLFLTDHKCQIVAKSWSGTNWIFKLEISQNKIINSR